MKTQIVKLWMNSFMIWLEDIAKSCSETFEVIITPAMEKSEDNAHLHSLFINVLMV